MMLCLTFRVRTSIRDDSLAAACYLPQSPFICLHRRIGPAEVSRKGRRAAPPSVLGGSLRGLDLPACWGCPTPATGVPDGVRRLASCLSHGRREGCCRGSRP